MSRFLSSDVSIDQTLEIHAVDICGHVPLFLS